MFEPRSLHQRQACFDARVKTRVDFRHNLITAATCKPEQLSSYGFV